MVVFLLLLNFTPDFESITTFYMMHELGFSTTTITNFSTFANLSYVLGLILYYFYFYKISASKFFLTTNFMLWIINVSFMLVITKQLEKFGFNNEIFCFLNSGIYSLISELNFMPICSIWCDLCPPNLEGSTITLFTGLINISNNMSLYAGAFL